MKKIVKSPLFLFSYFFIFWFGFGILTNYPDISWVEEIVSSTLFAIMMTISFRFINQEREPLYLRLSEYENVKRELELIGAKPIKVKGDKTFYRIQDAPWYANKILVKKTAFYIYVVTNKKFRDRFLQFESGKKELPK